ncbi:hypothetical protein [Pseudomonas viridiflava]|uniref:hypothetical protein n=1 Tax=Pseudomonas viridiflava TaxID=33069 RepID=UPI0013CECBD9|nr:hypothetical protein [Pseudomonas viridiflava]MEE4097671.1 hypothetical protein [Pseudomonas viridiflava]
MLWKKTVSYEDFPRYLAVLEAQEINHEKQLYGNREYRLKLSDGSSVTHTFTAQEYQVWWASISKGGQVVNP